MLDFDGYLIERLELGDEALSRARQLSHDSQISLARALVESGCVSDQHFAENAANYLDVPRITLADIPPVAIETQIPVTFLQRGRVLPVADGAGWIRFAMIDPFDETKVKAIRVAEDREVRLAVIDEVLCDRAFATLYGTGSFAIDRLAEAYAPLGDTVAQEDAEEAASSAPIVQLVNLILTKAIRMHASDVHIEPYARKLELRYRVDGMLVQQQNPPKTVVDAVTTRLKLMARLNISERRLPQDGRFTYPCDGREIDVRMSTVPTVHGESIVLRLLDKERAVFDFTELGLTDDEINRINSLLNQPSGMFLTTGPTGSGKTTSLYAALQYLNQPDRKILSIEDPVEYQLDGINQIPVRPGIGMGFASLLRNVLRQDPDVIMIGEMRDAETAEIAIRAAMTGHMVLSTAHTNSALGAITRLLDMGLPPYLISATLNAVIAQRLMRKLCENCRDIRPITETEKRLFATPPTHLPVARGCEACNNTGFKGRIGVFEIVPVDRTLKAKFVSGATEAEMEAHLAHSGHRGLFATGLERVQNNTCTLEELTRIVGLPSHA